MAKNKSSARAKNKSVGNPISVGLIPYLAIGININQLAEITSINPDRLNHLMRNESGSATWSPSEITKLNRSLRKLNRMKALKQKEINHCPILERDLRIQQMAEETCYWYIEQGFYIEEIANITGMTTDKVSECLYMRQFINRKS